MPTDITDRDRLVEAIQKLHGSSLDARKGSLAEQAADALLPFIREMQAEAVERAVMKIREWREDDQEEYPADSMSVARRAGMRRSESIAYELAVEIRKAVE